MDNLESGTYEVFEKDPIKYTEYQSAIQNALIDIRSQRISKNSKEIM
jgi:protein arginine N-methyltransferase 5